MDAYARIAPYYDAEHERFDEDIAFYRQLIDRDPVLEVGCGTGRLLLPLAGAGLRIHGIDPSASMLARAKERINGMPGVEVEQVGIEEFLPAAPFGTVLFPLNTLWHFIDTEAQISALRAAYRVLAGGGRLIVDLSNPLTLADHNASGEVRQRFSVPFGSGFLVCLSAAYDDPAEQLLALDLWYDEVDAQGRVRRAAAHLDLRYVYAPELRVLLRLAGFEVEDVYGSYEFGPYDAFSSNLIAVARRP